MRILRCLMTNSWLWWRTRIVDKDRRISRFPDFLQKLGDTKFPWSSTAMQPMVIWPFVPIWLPSVWLIFADIFVFFWHNVHAMKLLGICVKPGVEFLILSESQRLVSWRCRFVVRSQNWVKRYWNDLKFDVNIHGHEMRPTTCFYLNFQAIRGHVASRFNFVVRKILCFDVQLNDVRLTWNLIRSLMEVFWDNALALIFVS